MRIAIIGSGWVGCHLAINLKNNHSVKIYESNNFFSQTSFKNQNRLHLGYHYARNSYTREMCNETFNKFLLEYGHLTEEVVDNIYAVPQNESLIDYYTYLKIFAGWDHKIYNNSCLQNIEGSIVVKERYINPQKAKNYFHENLKDIIVYKNVDEEYLQILSNENDLVINCTNNSLNPINETLNENCSVLIYKNNGAVPFGALTMVDGNLFSIFPYSQNTFSLTDVEYTPNSSLLEEERVRLIEDKVIKYFPEFHKHFTYSHSVNSLKVKSYNASANRVPIIMQDGNIISCFTGKIQGIYKIQSYVELLCK